MIGVDTIAAVATGMGNSGIGIIRVSGEEAFSIIKKIFKKHGGKEWSTDDTYRAHYGYIYDEDELLDEVLILLMKGPHSYTAEDTVEIDCHGSVLMMKRILETVIKYGARPAQPGEFTKRAFLNGRIEYGIWNEYFGISFVTSVLTRENYLIRRTFPAIDFEGSA